MFDSYFYTLFKKVISGFMKYSMSQCHNLVFCFVFKYTNRKASVLSFKNSGFSSFSRSKSRTVLNNTLFGHTYYLNYQCTKDPTNQKD